MAFQDEPFEREFTVLVKYEISQVAKYSPGCDIFIQYIWEKREKKIKSLFRTMNEHIEQ